MFHARRTLFAVTVPCCNDCDGTSLSLRCRNGASSLPPFTHSCRKSALRAQSPTASDNLRTMRDRPSLPSPPSIVGLLRSDAPSSSNPNFATGNDVPTSLPSDVCRVRRPRPAVSFHLVDHPVPPSPSRRHLHDARMRGTGSEGRRQQQSRDSTDLFFGLSTLWGHIPRSLQHSFWNVGEHLSCLSEPY